MNLLNIPCIVYGVTIILFTFIRSKKCQNEVKSSDQNTEYEKKQKLDKINQYYDYLAGAIGIGLGVFLRSDRLILIWSIMLILPLVLCQTIHIYMLKKENHTSS